MEDVDIARVDEALENLEGLSLQTSTIDFRVFYETFLLALKKSCKIHKSR